ncbi:hypothetical protein ACFLS9_01025 [Bacteroidota bacterium]
MRSLSNLIIFQFVLLYACETINTPESSKAMLSIDLETDFQDDLIEIKLDGEMLLKESVTTNYSISAAWVSGQLTKETGNHVIICNIINLNKKGQYLFDLRDTLTIRINYDRKTDKINFSEFPGLIVRD